MAPQGGYLISPCDDHPPITDRKEIALTYGNGIQTLHVFWILFALAAYLLGSLPFGRLIGQRVADIDITQRGSRNIGATNVARELGLKWGIFTLLLDVLNGFMPVFLFGLFFPDFGIGPSVMGLFALFGHQFSVFLRFRGGKGVATSLGIFLAIIKPKVIPLK